MKQYGQPTVRSKVRVLEWFKGTEFWPPSDFWRGKKLFLETSEEKPSRAYIRQCLRNYGVHGTFERITGLLFGRARDYSDEEKKALDENIAVVAGEFRRRDSPCSSSQRWLRIFFTDLIPCFLQRIISRTPLPDERRGSHQVSD